MGILFPPKQISNYKTVILGRIFFIVSLTHKGDIINKKERSSSQRISFSISSILRR